MNLSRRNLLLSVCLHGGLVLLLWLVARPHTLPEPPPVMQAMLMPAGGAMLPAPQPALPADAPAPAPLPEPLPPPPEPVAPPKPVTPPKPAPEPAKPAAKPPVKPETVKPAEKKPEKQPPKPRIEPDAHDSELADVERETQRIAR